MGPTRHLAKAHLPSRLEGFQWVSSGEMVQKEQCVQVTVTTEGQEESPAEPRSQIHLLSQIFPGEGLTPHLSGRKKTLVSPGRTPAQPGGPKEAPVGSLWPKGWTLIA